MNGIKITREIRPCFANEKKALFHMWAENCEVILRLNGKADSIKKVMGIVEFEDGSVNMVYPQHIKFLDGKFHDYIWE